MPRSTLIEIRSGTAAQWTSANPVLALGEPGQESDTGNLKIGDGVHAWSALAYTLAGQYDQAGAAAAQAATALASAEANTSTAVAALPARAGGTGTGTVATAAPIPEYNIRDFAGADGNRADNTGVVDCTPAVNAIITLILAGNGSGIIRFPAGSYLWATTVTATGLAALKLRGDGEQATVITASPTIAGAVVGGVSSSNVAMLHVVAATKLEVEDLTLDGGAVAQIGTLATAITIPGSGIPNPITSISVAGFTAPAAAQINPSAPASYYIVPGAGTVSCAGTNAGLPGFSVGMGITDSQNLLAAGTTVTAAAGGSTTPGYGTTPPQTLTLSNAWPTLVIGGTTISGAQLYVASNQIVLTSGWAAAGVNAGQTVTGALIPSGTTVASISTSAITIGGTTYPAGQVLTLSQNTKNLTITGATGSAAGGGGHYLPGGVITIGSGSTAMDVVAASPVTGTQGTTQSIPIVWTIPSAIATIPAGTPVYAPVCQGANVTLYATIGAANTTPVRGALRRVTFRNINQMQITVSGNQYVFWCWDASGSYAWRSWVIEDVTVGPGSNPNQDACAINGTQDLRLERVTFDRCYRTPNFTTFSDLLATIVRVKDPVPGAGPSGNNVNRGLCIGEFATGLATVIGLTVTDANNTGQGIFVAARRLLGLGWRTPRVTVPIASITQAVNAAGVPTGGGGYVLITLASAPIVPLSAIPLAELTVELTDINGGTSGQWSSLCSGAQPVSTVVSTTSFTVAAAGNSGWPAPQLYGAAPGPGPGSIAAVSLPIGCGFVDLYNTSGSYPGVSEIYGDLGGGVTVENSPAGNAPALTKLSGRLSAFYDALNAVNRGVVRWLPTASGPLQLDGLFDLAGASALVTTSGAIDVQAHGTATGVPNGATLLSTGTPTTPTASAVTGLPIPSYYTQAPPTVTFATPANPTNLPCPTAGVLAFAGIGVTFTPNSTGKVLITITGTAGSTVNYDLSGKYGTGTPPANNAAASGTGTQFPGGALNALKGSGSLTVGQPFTLEGLVTGLTVGTPYWVDIAGGTTTGGDALALGNLTVTVQECT